MNADDTNLKKGMITLTFYTLIRVHPRKPAASGSYKREAENVQS